MDGDITHGAQSEWDRLSRQDDALLKGLTPSSFQDIYAHTFTPRFPGYVVACIGIFLLGTPLVLGFLEGMLYLATLWEWLPQPGEVATELYMNADGASVVRKVSPETLSYIMQDWSGFYFFFGILFFWIGIVFMMMRRYHAKERGTLREEILRRR
ncbi:MAG: hypothetical protein AAF723_00700 [Pseudomonadota bacterium]